MSAGIAILVIAGVLVLALMLWMVAVLCQGYGGGNE
jgi:hypothetical protein